MVVAVAVLGVGAPLSALWSESNQFTVEAVVVAVTAVAGEFKQYETGLVVGVPGIGLMVTATLLACALHEFVLS